MPCLHCPFDALVVGIGSNPARQAIAHRWQERGGTFVTLVHPAAVVAQDVMIGPGTVLCAGAIVNTGSRIGSHVILNTACSVDHHNLSVTYVHVAPGAHLGGDVQVAEGTRWLVSGPSSCRSAMLPLGPGWRRRRSYPARRTSPDGDRCSRMSLAHTGPGAAHVRN